MECDWWAEPLRVYEEQVRRSGWACTDTQAMAALMARQALARLESSPPPPKGVLASLRGFYRRLGG
jgi:hypothetical protein